MFSVYYQGDPFKLFSKAHIASLLTIIVLNIMLYFYSDRFKEKRIDKFVRNSIASILIITELSFQLWCAVTGVWTVEYNLPFHLCSAATIICAAMLYINSYRIYKTAYFWGLGGALQALLTPDLSGYNYPHYVFFKYFVLHGLIIISVLYMTFVHSYKINFKSVLNAFAVTNLFALIVVPIDMMTGGNYLFLCRKPEAFTLLDYLGPWPWYIVPMEAVVFIMFVILYLPFAISNLVQNHRNFNSGLSAKL